MMIVALYFCRKQIYGEEVPLKFNQVVGMVVAFLHYSRRVIESNFIHRFTEQPLPFTAIPGIMFYYWFLFGFVVMYFFLKPTYKPLFGELSDEINISLGVVFMIFETLNFKCHCITAGLRKPGSNERGIPEGFGFGIVTVANYMWEGFAWTTFVLLA